jgi:hypothetical protein
MPGKCSNGVKGRKEKKEKREEIDHNHNHSCKAPSMAR